MSKRWDENGLQPIYDEPEEEAYETNEFLKRLKQAKQFMVLLPTIYGSLDKSLLVCSFWHENKSGIHVKKTCLKKYSLEQMNKLCNMI